MKFNVNLSDGTEVEVSCHPDIAGMSNDGKTLIVVDWKSGYLESDYTNQFKAYAYACYQKFKVDYKIEKIMLIAVWLRSRTFDVKEYTVKEIEVDFIQELIKALESNVYSPSPDNCLYCPIYDCKAKAALTRSSITSLVEMDDEDDSEALTLSMALAYPKIQFIEKAAKHARDVIKQSIEDTGCRIKIEDGKYLGLRDSKISTIHLIEAMPIIAAYIMGEPLPNYEALIMKIAPALSIKKGQLLDLIALTADKGEIGKNKKDFLEALENAGAMTTTVRKSLAIYKEEK